MSMNTKTVLHDWKLDLEFNKQHGKLAKEGEMILAALTKATEQDIYSLESKELNLIKSMAEKVMIGKDKTKRQIAQSLKEQGLPDAKIPELVRQTVTVHKEARFILKTIERIAK